eukprot:6516065-Alexandrium_andersonii.AAC.1
MLFAQYATGVFAYSEFFQKIHIRKCAAPYSPSASSAFANQMKAVLKEAGQLTVKIRANLKRLEASPNALALDSEARTLQQLQVRGHAVETMARLMTTDSPVVEDLLKAAQECHRLGHQLSAPCSMAILQAQANQALQFG